MPLLNFDARTLPHLVREVINDGVGESAGKGKSYHIITCNRHMTAAAAF